MGCSVGVGEGSVAGVVSAPECDLNGEAYDLDPSFFSAALVEETLEIRIQRGSDLERFSDGIVIVVFDTNELYATSLGVPIQLGEGAPVRMSFYLHGTCPLDRDDVPVSYDARSGSITFRSTYAPDSDDDVEIAGRFDNVELTDLSDPGARYAIMSGEFRFFYNRGRPAQRFP